MELSLYELSESYRSLMNLDLDDDSLRVALGSLNQSVQEKATNIARVSRTLKAGAEAIKNEEERLKAKRKAIENREKKLREYLYDNMKAMDIEKVSTDTDTIYISGRDSSKVVDFDKVPQEYKEIIIDVKIDKRKLNKDIKTKDIPGVETSRNEWVVIK